MKSETWFAAYCVLCAVASLWAVGITSYHIGQVNEYNSWLPTLKYHMDREAQLEKELEDCQNRSPIVTHEVQAIYVDKPVEVEKIVYQDKVEYQPLKDFASLEELEGFLAQDNTDSILILTADSSGKVQFDGACEDYAFNLRDNAAAIGKRLEAELLTRSEYVKYYGDTGGLGVNDMHMVNKAVIGNDVYLIEPQEDKVWKVVELD